MHGEPPLYTLDDDTQSLVEEVLGLAQRTVDLQFDDEIRDDLQLILEETAARFGILQTELIVEDDGEGTVTIKLKPEEKPRPTLTIVASNDEPEG